MISNEFVQVFVLTGSLTIVQPHIYEPFPNDRSGLVDRQANQLPVQIEKQIVRLKRERPTWGAPKIRERLDGFSRISIHRR